MMAAANYNEVSHTNIDWNTMDPLYRWDTHFPERLSKLHMNEEWQSSGQHSSPTGSSARRQRRMRNRNCNRFKTQPITFDEIKEVDEETPVSPEDTKKDLKTQFAAFSRTMDGLLPGLPGRKAAPKVDPEMSKPRRKKEAEHIPEIPIEAAPAKSEKIKDVSPESGLTKLAIGSKSDSSIVTSVPVESLPQFDQSRARRQKKRRQRKSIEEEPELEKEAITNAVSQGAG